MQKTFQERFTVRGGDCDMFRRMRMDTLFMAMQEGGERHATLLGASHDAMMRRGLFFVLSRTHVHIDRMPLCGESVVHTTWPGNANKFFCPRYHTFTLEDGTPLLSAGALWVLLDTENRRIVSPAKIDLGFPDNSDLAAPTTLPNRLPKPGEQPTLSVRMPAFSEFDINGHVNNTKYVAWVCDALGSETLREHTLRELTVSYEKEIRDESPYTLALARDGETFTFQVLGSDGGSRFFACGELTQEDKHDE